MTDERDVEKEEPKVYEPSERPNIKEMSAKEFAEEFREYSELMLHVTDEVVVAASRDDDRKKLLEAFCRRFPDTKSRLVEYGFEHGPASLAQAAATIKELTFAERKAGNE